MIKVADLLDDEASLCSLIQGLLCDYHCTGGRSCMATPERDSCFCTESGIVLAEALANKRAASTKP